MSYFGNLLSDALSMESGVKMATEEGYVEQGDVMIEIPITDENISAEVIKITESLESKGWRVHIRAFDYSTEGGSDGVNSGQPSLSTDDSVNNVVNGVYMPAIKPTDVYQVVQVVRPEDTLPKGTSKILYLMNSEGDIKDMLRDEGHLVVDEKDALHLMLQGLKP